MQTLNHSHGLLMNMPVFSVDGVPLHQIWICTFCAP